MLRRGQFVGLRKPANWAHTIGQQYTYDLQVSDADGDALNFELRTAPTGMSVHPQQGTLRWLPTTDDIGQALVTLSVTDPQGGSNVQSFTVTTRRVGGPPQIVSTPPTEAAVGVGYLYSVDAVDAERDPLAYSLVDFPKGMTIDSRTGEIVWTPTAEQLGQQIVIISVADASGGRTTQGFAIRVAAGLPNRPPVISSETWLFTAVAENYSYTVAANDPEGQTVT